MGKNTSKNNRLENNIANLHAKGLGTNLFTMFKTKYFWAFFLNKLVHITYICVLASLPHPKGTSFSQVCFWKKKFFSCVALFQGKRGGTFRFFARERERKFALLKFLFFGVEKRVKKKFSICRDTGNYFFKGFSKTLLRGRRARTLCTRKQNLHFWSFKFRENGKNFFFRRRLLNFFFWYTFNLFFLTFWTRLGKLPFLLVI